MTTVVIPGGRMTSATAVHAFLATKLDFGPYYGNNLDALWDRLTTDVERPVRIVWTDARLSRELLGDNAFEDITRLLREVAERDAARGYKERLSFEIVD